MKRRKFLTIAGIGGAVVAVASGKFFLTTFHESAETLIKSELHFLRLDEQGVKDFVREYSKLKDRKYKLAIKSYRFLGVDASQSGKIHQMVSRYLLSSDFFINRMDETRIIRYVGLYDPYLKPCQHPFSHLRYPAGNGESQTV